MSCQLDGTKPRESMKDTHTLLVIYIKKNYVENLRKKLIQVQASGCNATELVNTPLVAGAAPDDFFENGCTLLHVAAFFLRTTIVNLLLDFGADPTTPTSVGSNALWKAFGALPECSMMPYLSRFAHRGGKGSFSPTFPARNVFVTIVENQELADAATECSSLSYSHVGSGGDLWNTAKSLLDTKNGKFLLRSDVTQGSQNHLFPVLLEKGFYKHLLNIVEKFPFDSCVYTTEDAYTDLCKLLVRFKLADACPTINLFSKMALSYAQAVRYSNRANTLLTLMAKSFHRTYLRTVTSQEAVQGLEDSYLTMLNLCITLGASVNMPDQGGDTALHILCREAPWARRLIAVLLKTCHDSHRQRNAEGETPLRCWINSLHNIRLFKWWFGDGSAEIGDGEFNTLMLDATLDSFRQLVAQEAGQIGTVITQLKQDENGHIPDMLLYLGSKWNDKCPPAGENKNKSVTWSIDSLRKVLETFSTPDSLSRQCGQDGKIKDKEILTSLWTSKGDDGLAKYQNYTS